MDPKNPRTYAFWNAFDTPEAQEALTIGMPKDVATVERLRKNLAGALIDVGFMARQEIKVAIATGHYSSFGTADDLQFITYERNLNSRCVLGRMVTRKEVQLTVTKEHRKSSADSWLVEVAFVKRVIELQKQGRLKQVVVPLLIGSNDKLLSFKRCQLEGKTAPTFLEYFRNSAKLREKLLMWCEVGDILLDLHGCDLIHGDFCDQQVCVTDDGPIVLDLESMLDAKEDIYIELSPKKEGRISQRVGNDRLGRFIRRDYYDWTSVARTYCRANKPELIKSSVAREVEIRAFALNMLDHMYGIFPYAPHGLGYTNAQIKSLHPKYFAAHADKEKEIANILIDIMNILLYLTAREYEKDRDFPKKLAALRDLCMQLPV